MPQHDGSNIIRRSCRCAPSSVIGMAHLLLLALLDLTFAFPTARLSSRKNNCVNSFKSICVGGEGVGLPTQRFWTDEQTSFALRAQPDSQDDFQRSLLAAKIANDIKDIVVKEENYRQERVEKQIVKEKEKLKTAVKEVQEAAQNVSLSAKNLGGAVISNTTEVKEAVVDVSQSAKTLGGAVITNTPRIITRSLTTLLGSEEFRLVFHSPNLSSCYYHE